MNKTFLLFVLLICLFSCNETNSLTPKTKTIIETFYRVKDGSRTLVKREIINNDTNGNPIEKLRYNGDNDLEWQTILKYNNTGKIIDYLNYNGDGIFQNRTVYQYEKDGNNTEFIYDENNILDKTIKKLYDNNKPKFVIRT